MFEGIFRTKQPEALYSRIPGIDFALPMKMIERLDDMRANLLGGAAEVTTDDNYRIAAVVAEILQLKDGLDED